jgi:hypothetical protein
MSIRRRVSGRSLAFPVSLSTLRDRGDRGTPLVTHASPSKTLAGSRGPCASPFPAPEGTVPGSVPDSSLGVHSKIAPPPVRMLRVHSRVNRGSPFGPELPPSGLVPPLSFHPTPTVYSAQRPAGLLHPATGQGFAMFPAGLSLPPERGRPSLPPRRGRRGLPSSMALTLRSFSLPDSRRRVTALPFPLAVGPGFRSPCSGVATGFGFAFSAPSASGR